LPLLLGHCFFYIFSSFSSLAFSFSFLALREKLLEGTGAPADFRFAQLLCGINSNRALFHRLLLRTTELLFLWLLNLPPLGCRLNRTIVLRFLLVLLGR
jgi:hypothetical protein